MIRNTQRTPDRSRSILEDAVVATPPERIRLLQNFLKIENLRLQLLHRGGAGGSEVVHRRSVMMDALIHSIFRGAIRSATSTHATPDTPVPEHLKICLVATGGYGRGELNPFSDVDILFLLERAHGPELAQIKAVVEQILYALWDLGLKVGHATRTIRECVDQSRKDMQSLTALLEGRFLVGSKPIFTAFQKSVLADCKGGRARDYVATRMKDQLKRHTKFGGTVFVQEPNVKNGCGGLRDLQNLLWIARVQTGITSVEMLGEEGFLSQIEAGKLTRAYGFLMRVRNELHYSNNHAVDEITLSAQPKIAEALGYHQKNLLSRIETFMRNYYRHARDIFLLTKALAERLAIEEMGGRSLNRWSRWLSFPKGSKKLEGGLILKNSLVDCPAESKFPSDVHDLLQSFRIAQIHQARLGFALQSRIRQHLRWVNRTFLYSKRARDIFMSILRAKGEVGPILRMMHECGLLGEYIPEFGQLDCLVQHEFYHRYTADEHTLLAIEKLDETLNATGGSAAPYSRMFQKLENAHLLYLAILLHDTGKSARVRHHSDVSAECARRVARRFCLDNQSSRTLLWLVDHHMTMANLVQRRDLDDPATIQDFQALVGTREHLDMLHLLTFVDGQAVGSASWSEWRQTLLWQLYERTAAALTRGTQETERADAHRERLQAAIRPRLPPSIMEDEIEAHFTQMPARYWQRVDEDELLWHFETLHVFFEKLLNTEVEGASPVVRWRHFPDRGYSEALVCSWDRHGLFAKIAGSFATARINILNADIYTRNDNLVLDLFQVCDLEHRAIQDETRIHRMLQILSESLLGNVEVSFTDLIRKEYENMRHLPHQGEERFPTTIAFNNEDSTDYSILEIQTPDRLGLLYHILDVLTRCGLDTGLARINTEMGAAMDVFYLTDTDGKKIIDPARLGTIQKELRETIDALNKPFRLTN